MREAYGLCLQPELGAHRLYPQGELMQSNRRTHTSN